MTVICIFPAPTEQLPEHGDDVEKLKKLRQLGGEGNIVFNTFPLKFIFTQPYSMVDLILEKTNS